MTAKMVVHSFAKEIDAVNAEDYYGLLLNIMTNRRDFIDTLEYILVCNHCLWFTPYGNLYNEQYGQDCRLFMPRERPRVCHYSVVIYNRY